MNAKAHQRAIEHMNRAKRALQAARLLRDQQLYEDSVSRSYYAVLHAAKAALAVIGVESSTHAGVRAMFGLHLVKTGKIEKEFADILVAEQEDREIGDYEAGVRLTEETARQRVAEAERFVQRIERHLERSK